MHLLIHPDEVRLHLAASSALSLVRLQPAAARDPSSIGDAEILSAMRAIVSDVSLASHPPLAAVADVLRILFHRDEVDVAAGASASDAVRGYRVGVVLPWLRDDPSLEALGVVARSRRGASRGRFLRFLAREIGRALHDLCAFPVRIDCDRFPDAEALRRTALDRGALAVEVQALQTLAAAWREGGRLLSDEQVSLLSYVRDEADVIPLREYYIVRSHLRPISLRAVQRTRRARYRQRQARDLRSPSMGGYSGLRAGGGLEQINALLPSELAQMDSSEPVDLFDLNLAEKRLLIFQRDQRIDIQRRRQFHVVFWAPERFDYRPQVVPARWPYLFLGVVFDVIRFFRDELTITNCPFYFIFHGKTYQIDRYERLITAIREQDFRDVEIACRAVDAGRLREHLEEAAKTGDEEHVLLCLAEHGTDLGAAVPLGMTLLQVAFAASPGSDSVVLDDSGGRHEFSITDEASLTVELNRFRNLLAVSMAGAQPARRT
jgi:hypothetical protein